MCTQSTAGNPPEGNPIGKDGATSIALVSYYNGTISLCITAN